MGNEMGNNNTSTIKEEDNISEAEKKTLSQDTSEVENGVSIDVDADSVNKEIQPILTSIGKDDAIENAAEASNDAATEPGKDTMQEGNHADDVKGSIQTVSTADSKDVEEKETYFASSNTSMNSSEGDTHAIDTSVENQMHPTTEAEHVQEKHTGLASDCSAIETGKVTLHDDIYADDVKEKFHTIPTAEANDVEEEAKGLISNNTEGMLENDSLEGDANSSNVSTENQTHSESEAEDEDVPEKPTGLDSEYYTISLLGKDLLKGDDAHADDNNIDHEKQPTADSKDDQEIASKLGFDDKASESQDKPEEVKLDADVVIPMANDIDVQGKDTIFASDDHLKPFVDGSVHDITEGLQSEKSPNTGSVEAEVENYEIFSSFSLEGSEECEIRNEPCLMKPLLITYDLLRNEPSIKKDNVESTVSTLNAVHVSNDSELQELLNIHSEHDENVEVLFEESHQGSESLIKDNFIDTNSHVDQIKEMETEEKMLFAENSASRDGNEFVSDLIETTGTTSDSPSIGNNSNGYITEDSLIPLPESFVVDNTLKSDHEENRKVIHDESIMRYSYSCSLDYCTEETLEEFKASIVNAQVVTTGSNGESNTVLGSDVSWIAKTDEVDEPKVGDGGIQFDAHANNCKPSDETNFVSEPKHSVVPEAEMVSLIGGSIVVDCRHKNGENYKNKMEETNGKSEASYSNVETSEGTEISEECNSDLVTLNHEEYFTLQNSSSLLHIYDSSDVTVQSLDMVDDGSFENEGEIYSHHIESTSLKGAKLTSSVATMSSEETCSNNSIFAGGGYETREIVTRFSTESESDNPNICSMIQKSPSFNLNLQTEARQEESDQAPFKVESERILSQSSLSLINNSMPNAEYDQCMLQNEEVAVEEKIVTMERSYSEKYKAPFTGLLKEEESHLHVMPRIQDNNSGTMKDVKEVSSTSPKGKEKRRARSSFFGTCMCCTTVAN